MNGAHLASPIRGELVYAHWAQLDSQIHFPIGNQIWGPLGKEDVCPNFALTVGKFVFSNSGNFRQRQIRQSPGLALNAHSGNDWGQIPVLTGQCSTQVGLHDVIDEVAKKFKKTKVNWLWKIRRQLVSLQIDYMQTCY